jgi:hypothetical protein
VQGSSQFSFENPTNFLFTKGESDEAQIARFVRHFGGDCCGVRACANARPADQGAGTTQARRNPGTCSSANESARTDQSAGTNQSTCTNSATCYQSRRASDAQSRVDGR